jgi:hypothetical protein
VYTISECFEWLRLKAIMSLHFEKDFRSIIKTIDLNQFEVLRERYSKKFQGGNCPDLSAKHSARSDKHLANSFRDPDNKVGGGQSRRSFRPPEKYVDIDKHFWIGLRRVYRLKLHRARPMNILDIGTGAGYFPYICNYFGHRTVAIDKDDVPIFNDVTSFLRINRRVWKIRPFQKLPSFENRFDLITAFRVCFDRHQGKNVWQPGEWDFFLRHLSNDLLTDNGQVFLDMNAREDGKVWDEDLLRFFLHHGARVHHSKVYFKSMNGFR